MKKLLIRKYAGYIPFFAVNIGLLAYMWFLHAYTVNPDNGSLLILSLLTCFYIFLMIISLRAKVIADETAGQDDTMPKISKMKKLAEKYWPYFGVTAGLIILIFFFNPVFWVIATVMLLTSGIWLCPSSANQPYAIKKQPPHIRGINRTYKKWGGIIKFWKKILDYFYKFMAYKIKDREDKDILNRLVNVGKCFLLFGIVGVAVSVVVSLLIYSISPTWFFVAYAAAAIALLFSCFGLCVGVYATGD